MTWTAERLDALPEGTMIECEVLEGWWVLLSDGDWWLVGEEIYLSSESLLEDSDGGSIRVVSVPVDALLSDEAEAAGGEALWSRHADVLERKVFSFAESPSWMHYSNHARAVLRAAIAHVTGEAS